MITRVVDYGGLFWDDVLPGHVFAARRPPLLPPRGLDRGGREKLDRMRPIAERHGLTPLQLACHWNLAHRAGRVRGAHADPGAGRGRQADRAQARGAGGAARASSPLSAEEVDEMRAIGDNTGSMPLKGATPDHEGDERPTAGRSSPSTRSWPAAGASTPSATCARAPGRVQPPLRYCSSRRSAGAPRCPRVGLVEAVRVALERSALGGSPLPEPSSGVRRAGAAVPAPSAPSAPPSEWVSSDSGRALAGASIFWSPLTSRELDRELERAALEPAEAGAVGLRHVELELRRRRADRSSSLPT